MNLAITVDSRVPFFSAPSSVVCSSAASRVGKSRLTMGRHWPSCLAQTGISSRAVPFSGPYANATGSHRLAPPPRCSVACGICTAVASASVFQFALCRRHRAREPIGHSAVSLPRTISSPATDVALTPALSARMISGAGSHGPSIDKIQSNRIARNGVERSSFLQPRSMRNLPQSCRCSCPLAVTWYPLCVRRTVEHQRSGRSRGHIRRPGHIFAFPVIRRARAPSRSSEI